MKVSYPGVFTRLRRQVVQAAAGRAPRLADWNDKTNPPVETPILGAFISAASAKGASSSQVQVGRETAVASVSLYGNLDSQVDLRVGDRVRDESTGEVWDVDGPTMNYLHPFTGWQAGSETPLKHVRG